MGEKIDKIVLRHVSESDYALIEKNNIQTFNYSYSQTDKLEFENHDFISGY